MGIKVEAFFGYNVDGWLREVERGRAVGRRGNARCPGVAASNRGPARCSVKICQR